MSHLEPELLSAWLDEAVDDAERAQIEQHLPRCAACQAELDALGFARARARELPRPEISELHRKQLWRELNRARRAPATRWRALVAVAGTAAAIAAFAGITMIGSSSGPNVLATNVRVEPAPPIQEGDLESLLAVSTRAEMTAGAPAELQPMQTEEFGDETTPPTAGAPAADTVADDGREAAVANDGAQIARCEELIAPGGEDGAIALRYLLSSYRGEPVYVLVYDIPRDAPTHREVFVVTRTECRVLAHRSSV